MTDERNQITHIDETVKNILSEIKGTPSGQGGILPRLNAIENSISILRKQMDETMLWQKKTRSILTWIGVGIGIGGFVFGYFEIRDVVEALKAIK